MRAARKDLDKKQIDIELHVVQLIDSYAKLLELDHNTIWETPIPLLKAMVMARLENLKESRLKAEKTGNIDIFTKEDYYGLQAINLALSQLFSGKSSSIEDHSTTRNISGYTQLQRPK